MDVRHSCGVRGYVLCALCAVVSVFGGEARAQFFYDWANPAGGSYHTSGNWFPSGVPNTIDEGAGFSQAGTYNVFFTSDVTAGEAEVSAGTVTFDLNAGGTKRTYNVASLSAVGTGHLVIDDGTVAAGNVLVQNSASITIAGPSSVLGGELLVSGNINVNGGSLIDERTSFSTPLPPSPQNVTVQNGGTYKGRLGSGTNTVAGAGSTFSTRIDLDTSAALNVHSGAAYIGSILFVDSVTVTGAGSSLTARIGTGERRTSVLNILDGAYMDSPAGGWIGVGTGGNGVVTVEGVGSRLTTNDIWIGSDPQIHGMGESGRLTIGWGRRSRHMISLWV